MPALSKVAKPGAWIELGLWGKEPPLPICWRIAGKLGREAWLLITAGVVTRQPFDRKSQQHPDGDNRWRDSSLRRWLDTRFAKTAFTRGELASLIAVERVTEVTTGYSAERPATRDTTEDRVWVASWEEYKKMPKDVQGGARADVFLRDYPGEVLEIQLHWSRTPLADLGVALHEHWERERRHTNSGASQSFAIRPCIALAADTPVSGKAPRRARSGSLRDRSERGGSRARSACWPTSGSARCCGP
jgi:hypothetical protein